MTRPNLSLNPDVRRLTPRMKKQRNRGVDPLTAISDEEGIRLGNVARATVKDQIKANNPPKSARHFEGCSLPDSTSETRSNTSPRFSLLRFTML